MNIHNKLQHLLAICLVCSLALLSIACKEDEKPEPAVEQKKVTGLNILLTSDQKGVADVTVDFRDASGLAGKTSTNAIMLDANATYTGLLALEDATQNPPKAVTGDYLVSFQVANANATFSMSGQSVAISTGAASTGTNGMLHVELKRDGQTQKVSFPLMVRQ